MTEAAKEILARLEEAGISLTVAEPGERLIAKPTELVTPAVVITLREYRAEILAQLQGDAPLPEVPREEAPPPAADPREAARADHLGLVAMWPRRAFGYVAIHDPTMGEWHDVPVKSAPGWAIGEAKRRKALWRSGDRKAYKYTQQEMEELWGEEEGPMWMNPYRPENARAGLIYDTDLEEE
jgi:hypothetical protein